MIPVTYAMMWIGSSRIGRGSALSPGIFSKDIVSKPHWRRTRRGHYAFWLGIAGGILTAFYSWRLLFMTFHGKPRCDETVLAHVHESPKVMHPAAGAGAGACSPVTVAYDLFVGQGRAFWGDAILILPPHTP